LFYWRWQDTWLIISVIPFLFAFLYDVNTGLRAVGEFKVSQNTEIREVTKNANCLDAMKVHLAWKDGETTRINSWTHTLQLLFFAALSFCLARVFHHMSPIGQMMEDCEAYADKVMCESSKGDLAAVKVKKEDALAAITQYEARFGVKVPEWSNAYYDDERIIDLKTVRAGAAARYQLEATRRLMLLAITSFFYFAAAFMLLIALCFHSYIVARGV
jgi:hypothetical protein